MHRIGLALSGGGFRATLYHLGVVRFLRDAQILPQVVHITSVSGGSVLGAHLALNWDKYCGSEAQFEEAAHEIIRFVQLDVRNRIVRRFPLTSAVNLMRRLVRLRPHRQFTRAGLLEQHYERFLYGDTSLFELPDTPRLDILATNLSEGCLCSFYQGGLLMQRRTPGRSDRFERVPLGLATVPMAVAASSAFPGFFPPLELTGWDAGTDQGEFDRQAFTDGGVYDNLGLRMFRLLKQTNDQAGDCSVQDECDAILMSDAGGKFKVTRDGRAAGLIRTALRSSDILMDRVWQLELEAFENAPDVVFIPMLDVVERARDPLAPHPEIQRQAARIRVDLDRFSDLEISALVQHGYCVARQVCGADQTLLPTELPSGPPWDPFQPEAADDDTGESPPWERLSDESRALSTARKLQPSSVRRIGSTLLTLRDWPTYLWVPLVACIALSLPYTLYKMSKRAQQQQLVLTAIAETSPVYRKILELLEHDAHPNVAAMRYTDVETMEPMDLTGFEVISDTRIFDLRQWSTSTDADSSLFVHTRVRMRKTDQAGDDSHLRFQGQTVDAVLNQVCRSDSLKPTLSRMRLEDGSFLWQLDLDFSHVPIDGDTEAIFEGNVLPEMAEHTADGGRFQFTIFADTGLLQIWMLMPTGREYDYFEISSFPVGQPEFAHTVVPTTKVELPLGSIATFRIINPKHNYRYECRWKWSENSQSE